MSSPSPHPHQRSNEFPLTSHIEYAGLGVKEISVRMGGVGYYSTLFQTDSMSRTMEGGGLYVDEEFRGLGIGEQLVRRAVEIGLRNKVRTLEERVTSQYGLAICGRVFGPENLTIEPVSSLHTIDLPALDGVVSFDEAKAWLAEAEQYEEPNASGYRTNGFFMSAQLSSLTEKE